MRQLKNKGMKLNFFVIALGLIFITLCISKNNNIQEDQEIAEENSIVSASKNKSYQIDSNGSEPDIASIPLVDSLVPIKLKEYYESLNHWTLDTLFENHLRLQVNPEYLETFIIQEWEEQDTLVRIKYFELAFNLIVYNNGEIIVDTVLSKQTFVNNLDSGFFNISHFHGYWLNHFSKEDNTIIMYGNICKPDTDWCFFFNHLINIETGKVDLLVPEYDDDI